MINDEDALSEQGICYDSEMHMILTQMLENDETVSARGVIRKHSSLRAASSVTRNPARAKMLAVFQAKQAKMRQWKKRLEKKSREHTVTDLADKELRILVLERENALLKASHIAMIRVMGELGGFAKWVKFFEGYDEAKRVLTDLTASASGTNVAQLRFPRD